MIFEGDGEKKRKPKKVCPKHIFIFDDIGNELKLPSISQHRHLKSKVIISSQYLNDLSVQGRKNIDYWILFKGQTLEKLEIVYRDADINIPFEKQNKIRYLIQLIQYEEPRRRLYPDIDLGPNQAFLSCDKIHHRHFVLPLVE